MWEVQGAIWIIIALYLFIDLLVRLFVEEPFFYRGELSGLWRCGKVGYLIMFSLWGFGLVYISASSILSRALIEVDGRIIESTRTQYQPDVPYTANYFCTYIVEPNNGGDSIQYVAGNNDSSLSRDLAVGTQIEKKKWEIKYKLNGEIIEDFPIQNDINLGCLGVLLVIINLIRIGYLYYDQVFR